MMVHEVQQQDNWCWAACFRMACSFFGTPADLQCSIAQQFLNLTGCCPPGNNPDCDKTLDENSIATLYSSAALSATVTLISDESFRQALANGHLVLLMLQFPTAFHFVLLSGFDAVDGYVVEDPKFKAPFNAEYGQISTAYGNGQIANAWIVSGR